MRYMGLAEKIVSVYNAQDAFTLMNENMEYIKAHSNKQSGY